MLWSSSLVTVVVAIGFPALIVLFYFEGLILGKVVQPPVIFVAFIVATDPTLVRLAAFSACCLVASTLGHWTVYRLFREDRTKLVGGYLSLPSTSLRDRITGKVGESRLDWLEARLDSYGWLTILVATALPVVRGLPSIIAGTKQYPYRRFVVAAAAGNTIYLLLLVGAALGVGGLAEIYVSTGR